MQPSARHGVTLLELLVVIAIISLLASLLFSVLINAQRHARKVTCVANQRQIGLVILMMADDNNDRMPPASFWSTAELPEKLLVCPIDVLVPNGYVYNQAVIGKPLSEISHEDIIIADGDTPNHIATKPSDYVARHFNKAIACYGDGHVELFKP